MNTYELGQRVHITGTAVKAHEDDRTFYPESGQPRRAAHPTDKIFTEGIIVGSRIVQPGITDPGGFLEPRVFLPDLGQARRVWVVAFDLRMNPCWCFDHQIEPI